MGISQVLAQNPNPRKAEADKLLQQGNEFDENNQPQAALKAFEKALSIYRETQDQQGEGKTLNYIGNIYNDNFEEYSQAVSYYQKALKIAQKINDRTLESKVLNNLGLVQLHLENYRRAVEYCEQALAIARQNNNYETEAIALKSLGAIYIVSDSSKGLDFLEQSLIVLEKASGTAEDKLRQNKLKASIIINLGNFYYSLGGAKRMNSDPAAKKLLNKSLEYYQQGLKIAQEIGDRPRQGKALLGMGDLYHLNSQYTQSTEGIQQASAKAIESFEQALKIFATDKNFRSQARLAYSKLGDVYYRWGNKKKALDAYEQALQIIETEVPTSPFNKLEQDAQRGWLLINFGNINADASKYDQALDSYKKALEILELSLQESQQISTPAKQFLTESIKVGMKQTYLRLCLVYKLIGQPEASKKACQDSKSIELNYPLPKSLSNKGTVLNKAAKSPADLEKAKKELQEALESLRQSQALGTPDFIAFHLAQVGAAYTQLGEYKLAQEYFQKAIEIITPIDSPQFKPYIFFVIGEFYDWQKQYDLAFQYYQKAGEFANQADEKLIEANVFKQFGITGFLANRLPEATTALYRAIDVFDAIRVDLLDDKYKISIFEIQANTYSLLQKTLISQDKFSEALEVAERGRARAFINLLALRVGSKNQSKSNLKIPNVLPPKIAEIQRIAKEQNATIVEYAVPKPPRYNDANNNDKLVWDNSELYIWVIQPTGEIEFKPVDFKSLNASLADFVRESRLSIGAGRGRGINVDPTDKPVRKRNLQKLHEVLIEPIASLLPTNPEAKVIFIPHDSLFLVPFAALQDKDKKYLIEKHTILTAPAIQILDLTRQQRQKVTGKDVLVMGNPIMPKVGNPSVQLDPLKGAEIEALTIANLFKTKAITGKDATKAALKQKLSTARIIHLATHGLLDDPSQNIKTAIALAPTNNDDGLLTPAEIVDLRFNAELVVLSACDTARGTITGDGVIGLSRALITAGAPSVIVSLWKVPDSPTSELMTEFYRQWEKNPDKAVALRNAMLLAMKKYPEPRNWAAFTLIGES
ncbi:CHAT domain-containing protein [Nostoc sp. FACHB-973]|nr:CHAT domain-containing protein [Nostoc sp. FACHB-973]